MFAKSSNHTTTTLNLPKKSPLYLSIFQHHSIISNLSAFFKFCYEVKPLFCNICIVFLLDMSFTFSLKRLQEPEFKIHDFVIGKSLVLSFFPSCKGFPSPFRHKKRRSFRFAIFFIRNPLSTLYAKFYKKFQRGRSGIIRSFSFPPLPAVVDVHDRVLDSDVNAVKKTGWSRIFLSFKPRR